MSEEYLCADCGSDLTHDGFINAVCHACGSFNAITRRDYHAYADSIQSEDGSVRLVLDNTIDGVVLTDGDAWLQYDQPADTQANL